MKPGKWVVVVAMGASLALGGLTISPEVASAAKQPAQKKQAISRWANNGGSHPDYRAAAKNGNNRNGQAKAQSQSECSYPPVNAPTVTLVSSVGSVKPNKTFTLSGAVTVNSCAVRNSSVGIFLSGDRNGTYQYGGATTTDNNGYYTFQMTQPDTRYYQTASAATFSYNSGLSPVVTVTKAS